MRFSATSIASAILLATSTTAQLITTTYTWAQGDTVVMSIQTNAAGLPIDTLVVSTITGAAGVTTTPTTTRTTARTTATTATTATTDADGRPTTTGPRVVGQDTSYEPMRTTTYWYDTGNGYWTSAEWTASVTAAPTVATAIVPEGTRMDYEAYQSSVNRNVFSNAQAAVASQTRGAAGKRADINAGPMMGLTGVVLGAIGAGVGVLAL